MNNEGCVAGNLDSTDGTGWKDFPHADYTDDADLEENWLAAVYFSAHLRTNDPPKS